MSRLLTAVMFVLFAGFTALPAQTFVPPDPGSSFRDTSMLKPPAGAKVAVIEWEDLECPACAHAFPLVHEAINKYKIPLVRYDFQIPGHLWSHEGSLYARYLQDKVSPAVAEDYRRQVFASQFQIASKDDLHKFTVKFFQAHGQQIPFVLDPTGQFEKEVDADKALGEKLGLQHTPTVVVVTPTHWTAVDDLTQLYSVIDAALAQTAGSKAPVHKTTTAAHKS